MGLTWQYDGKDFTEDLIGNNYGFVYQIINLTNGRKYIGKKFFYSAKTKQVKGKKKKIKVPSDWQTYYGSSDILKQDVLQLGHDKFNREILHLCQSKGECGYLEAKEQFVRGVMETEDYYNTWIMVRVRKSHIKDYNARLLKTIETREL
jgi:antitoxin component YwqK of YwqJK toxin-antitoxin module